MQEMCVYNSAHAVHLMHILHYETLTCDPSKQNQQINNFLKVNEVMNNKMVSNK